MIRVLVFLKPKSGWLSRDSEARSSSPESRLSSSLTSSSHAIHEGMFQANLPHSSAGNLALSCDFLRLSHGVILEPSKIIADKPRALSRSPIALKMRQHLGAR